MTYTFKFIGAIIFIALIATQNMKAFSHKNSWSQNYSLLLADKEEDDPIVPPPPPPPPVGHGPIPQDTLLILPEIIY